MLEREAMDDLPVCITEHTGQAGQAEGRPHRTRAQEAHGRPLVGGHGAQVEAKGDALKKTTLAGDLDLK